MGASGPMYRRPANSADVRWYVADGLGSVVGEVDVNGNMTSSTKRDVYGLTRSASGAATSRQGFVGQSCGHLTDPETGGLVYMRARYYDAGVGRFISQDPAYNGNNWFAYCNNDPVNCVDNNGKNPVLIIGALTVLIAAIFGGIAECIASKKWDWQTFLRGAGFAAATTLAGLVGGPILGAIVGALCGAGDAWLTGGNPLLQALLGGVFGAVGGGAAAPLIKVGASIAQKEVVEFLMLGACEGALEGAADSLASN